MIRALIHGFCFLLTKVMTILYLPKLLYYKCVSPKRCPPVSDPIYFLPATKLAARIRTGEVSSARTVEAYINRIKEVNPVLNAVVEERFDAALEEARLVDAYVARGEMSVQKIGEKYPLLGVPITIKEVVAVAGMSQNGGYKGNGPIRRADKDADCVAQLKSAGVIILLVSNTPELCYNWETFNHVTGRTLNPYDTRRTCGGSSGGEAVLLASCASVIGVGSDVVGSLRLPPTFCGIYGHKPSPQLISTIGHLPPCTDEELYKFVFSFGPMTRYAVDLPILTNIMAKPNMRQSANLLQEVDPQTINVYYMESSGEFVTDKVNEDIVNAIRKVIRRLKISGIFTKKIQLEEMSDSLDLTFLFLLNIKTLEHAFSYGKSFCLEVIKTLFCMGSVIPNAFFYACVKVMFKWFSSDERNQRNMKLVADFREKFINILGDDGVFIYPAFPATAHFHDQIYSKFLNTAYLGIFNVLGFPVTICPLGVDTKGLPIGIQVVAKPFNDKLCFAMAKELEKNFGGWTPPPYTKQIHNI
ncbi:PREDICTED: fatty-acid amide hydrolase 2-like [Nicrophorus vespilloides]|uniref:Fatty-acid amide hydrolase 2-like n=1 Tax=Nicrophorus vespilloides TaxID=110193 RepID=A0ABM1N8X7_NICVS|nr:PREDICTED: fatty-acid amide hydrolase 2-like [Nicrophorus vespilloides]